MLNCARVPLLPTSNDDTSDSTLFLKVLKSPSRLLVTELTPLSIEEPKLLLSTWSLSADATAKNPWMIRLRKTQELNGNTILREEQARLLWAVGTLSK